jgi:hypothetical protein
MIFSQGLNAYYNQYWQEAIREFDKSVKIHKNDGPLTYYLQLCEKHTANPPGKMWDGLFTLKTNKRRTS